MNFFDTVAGQRFTEGTMPALVSELKKLNKKRTQYVRCYNDITVVAGMESEIIGGAKVVSTITTDTKIIVVYEKEKEYKNMKDSFSREDIIKALMKTNFKVTDDEQYAGALTLVANILGVSENEVADMLYDGVDN